jgi:lipopolysaccharide export system protein LptA
LEVLPGALPITALLRQGRSPGLLLGLTLCALAAGSVGHAEPQVVTPTTGVVSIESDVQRADNLTGVVTASGNVRIVYPDRRLVATARQAQYFSREGRVVLSGDVDVIQADGPSLRAERITYLVDQQRLIAEPTKGQQVLSNFPIAPLTTDKPDRPTP